jgi:hypothetical protein
MARRLLIKCPKCRKRENIVASETIEATTDFLFQDGICVDTNNEYGCGINVTFVCKSCGHRWTGRKGVTIDNYTED